MGEVSVRPTGQPMRPASVAVARVIPDELVRVARQAFIALVAFVGMTASALAGYKEAADAFAARDYKGAISELMPLAEAGDVEAQEQLALMQSHAAILRGARERYLPAEIRAYDEALRWLRPLAEAKRPKAMARLAVLEALGRGTAADPTAALKRAQGAAGLGDVEAEWLLARLYLDGRGVPKDAAQGLKHLQRAAAMGHSAAAFDIGDLNFKFAYYRPDSPELVTKALIWMQRAWDHDQDAAAWVLQRFFTDGLVRPPDPELAAIWARRGAERGFTPLMRVLGVMYLQGYGVPKSIEEGVDWIIEAAEQGEPAAQYRLGWMHDKGVFVPPDLATATYWFDRAAEGGEPRAMVVRCADQLYGLVGTEKDVARGVALCRAAANAGNLEALYELGVFYINHIENEADQRLGFLYLVGAAERGHAAAQNRLGVLYEMGVGVEPDPDRAKRWYARGAAQGDHYAQVGLGIASISTDLQAGDDVEAFIWISLGLADGRIEREDQNYAILARQMLAGLRESLSPVAMERAKRRIATFKPKPERPFDDEEPSPWD